MLENLIAYLKKNNELDVAKNLLHTLGKHAFSFEEYDNVAKCFFKIKDYYNSIIYSEKAKCTAYSNEQMWAAKSNLINVYNHANYPEFAMEYIYQQLLIKFNDLDTMLSKSFSHFLLNERDEAEKILLNALNNVNDLPPKTKTKILFNLGTYELYRDNFQKGLELFLLKGKELEYWKKPKLNFKFWEGGILPNKYIVLYAEAGIGDEIINVRFMKHLQDYGMIPIWHTKRKDLMNIFNYNNFKTISYLNELNEINFNDIYYTHPMSLPYYLNLKYKDLYYGPYLKPNLNSTGLVNKDSNKLKIGLRWQGNQDYDQDLHRTIPIKQIYDKIKHLNADFYSLQRDVGLEELKTFDNNIIDLSDKLSNFEITTSVINDLDIVITSCTSIAHMSAAMGKKTFIFVPITAYYLYCNSYGKKTPWYGDNVTVLRQIKTRCWNDPINNLNLDKL